MAAPIATTPASMHPQRRSLAWINVVGGIAVLASYVHGILSHPATRGEVWGGVPEALQPLYATSMLAAALGYFAFTSLVFLRLDPDEVRIGRYGFGLFNALYAAVLVPSALWMPLTFAMLAEPSPILWWAIRLDLALVGIASLGLLAAIAAVRPAPPAGRRRAALIGAAAFCFQTAVLDALVWTALFPV
jgi:hypothetical protein